jgi:hypothetical protein
MEFGAGGMALSADVGELGLGPELHLGLRYRFSKYFSFKVALAGGQISGSDAGTINDGRDYSYNTILIEPSVRAEFYYFTTRGQVWTRKGLLIDQPKFSSYAYIGFGIDYFNPTPGSALVNDFSDDFSKTAPVLPMGIGGILPVGKRLSLAFEIGFRYLYSDYIDGYSPVKWAYDAYYVGGFRLNYRFDNEVIRD